MNKMDESRGNALHIVEGVDFELSGFATALDAVLQSGVVTNASRNQ